MEALKEELAVLEEIKAREQLKAELEEQILALKGQAVEKSARVMMTEIDSGVAPELVPSKPGDILDEALIVIQKTPRGSVNRLQSLIRKKQNDVVRTLLREAAIEGQYAADIDGLNQMDMKDLPENSQSLWKSRDALRRKMVSMMIRDAEERAAIVIEPARG